MKLLIMIAAIATLASCTKTNEAVNKAGCALQTSMVDTTAVAAQTHLGCKNLDAIKVSLALEAAKLNICKPAPADAISTKSVIGNVLCAPMVESLLGGALAKIPAEWECTGGELATAKVKLLEACNKAL